MCSVGPSDPTGVTLTAASLAELLAPRAAEKTVDLGASLQGLSLENAKLGLLQPQKPSDKMATELAKLVKEGKTKPFVAADLKDFDPEWAAIYKASGPRTFEQFCTALLRRLLAAVATNQLTLAAALAHYDVCLKVSARARREGKSTDVGMEYHVLACQRQGSPICFMIPIHLSRVQVG